MHDPDDGYGIYADFYDALNSDRAYRIERIQSLLRTYAPDCRSVLELACGTGSILAGLDKRYEMTGLDMSPAMLRIARAKLPHVHFVRADMTNFALHKQFDAIFCTYNSMDHLPAFDAWEAVFAHAAMHLKPGGLFLFDTNTVERLRELAAHRSWTRPVSSGSVKVSISPLPDDTFLWRMSYRPASASSPRKEHAQEVRLRAFPPERIAAALQKQFELVDVVPAMGDPFVSEDAGRLYFIAKKRPD